MNLSYLANASGIAAEYSLYEKWIASAKVILTGFAVVFAVLLLLIAIIKLYSTIVIKVQDRSIVKKNKKVKVAQPGDTLKKPVVIPVQKNTADEPAVSDGIDDEVVAVIAAAVTAMYGTKGKAKIKSIKKSGGRSAWANAGILDNTRPF
ncbi:MAG: OadG family transporter subunit [Ruminococcus sp.]|nr:OadG family transporter subunit [Ruminococcus sp.]